MLSRSLLVCSSLVLGLTAGSGQTPDAVPPRSVQVQPVFFVPKGENPPKDAQSDRLMKHLDWARTRYRELLRNQDTFAIVEGKPREYRSRRTLAFYRDQPDGAAPHLVDELLTEWKLTRFNCPYVLVVVVINPKDDFPVGGGRPLNGGINTGGGVIQISTFAMDRMPNFQSTLQHELGHAFGLPHVDAYSYDMGSNESIMSYNLKHRTKEFTPSDTPGVLIPEDLRALALNRRVFPKLRFDPVKDVPAGYKLAERIVPLGPMKIPNHPDMPKFTTESGEEFATRVANLATGPVGPNKKGKVTFNAATMWQSGKARAGWVSLEVAFPYAVELSQIAVHSQHSGQYHAARAVRIAVSDDKGKFRPVAQSVLKSADERISLPRTRARVWRFEFQAGESQSVTLRGLRFFSGDDELFPPLVPSQ